MGQNLKIAKITILRDPYIECRKSNLTLEKAGGRYGLDLLIYCLRAQNSFIKSVIWRLQNHDFSF